jgi:hypothetical protein
VSKEARRSLMHALVMMKGVSVENNKRQLYLQKREDGSIYPSDGESAEIWAEMKQGMFLFSYVPRKNINRNVYFHRKYFKMLGTIFDHQERFPTVDQLRKEVIKEAGFYHLEYTFGGIIKVADSISFTKMSQEEFEVLYSKSVDVCIKAFCHDDNMFNLLMSYL